MSDSPKKKVIDIYPPKSQKAVFQLKEESVLIKIESSQKPLEQSSEVLPTEREALVEEEPENISAEEDKTLEELLAAVGEPTEKQLLLPHRFNLKSFLLHFILPVILIGFVYYLGFVAFTKAEVTISTKKLTLSLPNIKVLVDKNITAVNTSQRVLPGTLFTFSKTVEQEFKSTGQGKDEEKAKGTITIINNFSTSPQILVANTRFETPDGKIFRLDSRTVVPGATLKDGQLQPASIEAQVTADQAGPDYNIPPCNTNCKFTIPGFEGTPKFEGFYAISNEAMSGGSFGSVPLVTIEDKTNAEAAVREEMEKQLNEDLKNQIPPDLVVLNEAKSSLNIKQLVIDAEVGDVRQSFKVTATGELMVIAFKQQDLIQILQAQFEPQKPEKYDYCQEPTIEYLDISPKFSSGTLQLTLSVSQTLCYRLSPEEIKNTLAGKNQEELDVYLKSLEGVEQAQVKLFPFWLKKIPTNPQKINLKIN